MKSKFKGLIIKKNADLFSVDVGEDVILCKPRGILKQDGIFVGDYVNIEGETIVKVMARKNLLVRPPIANLDRLFIVISQIPGPDFLLVDKLLLYCFVLGVKPYIIISKQDIITNDFSQKVKTVYKDVCEVIVTSAKDDDVKSLSSEIIGICAFAGQSAVGKSSIINSLIEGASEAIGELSVKIARGKQTTRIVSLYKYASGYIADTAGFSMLDLNMVCELEPVEVSKYYPDFLPYLSNCKYRTCLHKLKKDCGVVDALGKGKLDTLRYENYLKIIDSLHKKY